MDLTEAARVFTGTIEDGRHFLHVEHADEKHNHTQVFDTERQLRQFLWAYSDETAYLRLLCDMGLLRLKQPALE